MSSVEGRELSGYKDGTLRDGDRELQLTGPETVKMPWGP